MFQIVEGIKPYLDNRWVLYIIILSTALVGAVGDGFLNQAAKYAQPKWILPGMLCINFMGILFYVLVLRELMGWSIIMLLLANLVFALAIGCMYFKERLSAWEWVGIGLAILAMVAMELGHMFRSSVH